MEIFLVNRRTLKADALLIVELLIRDFKNKIVFPCFKLTKELRKALLLMANGIKENIKVEYSSSNIAKYFQRGHLRATVRRWR